MMQTSQPALDSLQDEDARSKELAFLGFLWDQMNLGTKDFYLGIQILPTVDHDHFYWIKGFQPSETSQNFGDQVRQIISEYPSFDRKVFHDYSVVIRLSGDDCSCKTFGKVRDWDRLVEDLITSSEWMVG